MTNIETRYAELRVEDADSLSGVVIPYNSRTRIHGFTEEVKPGAFAGSYDIIANVHHDRTMPVARTGTEWLSLDDGADGLRMTLRYPPNPGGRAAKEWVNTGVLRGLSVEMVVRDEEWEGSHRIVRKAALYGFGIVDRPAYEKATIDRSKMVVQESGVFALSDDRRGGVGGSMNFGDTSIISMQRRQAVRFMPGSIDIESMPVTLLHGASFDNVLAATGADSLVLRVTAKALGWAAAKLVGTQVGKDVQKLLRGNLISGFRLGYVVDPENVTTEEIELNGFTFSLENIHEKAILCDIRLTSDGTGGSGKVRLRMRGA